MGRNMQNQEDFQIMQSATRSYRRTIAASFIGYVVQAAICSLAPLLYVQFRSEFSLTLDQISLMITITFFTQLLVDLTSSPVVARFGCRACIVAAHFLAAAGFFLMSILPDVLPSAYAGLLIAAIIYSLGAGLIEVLVSPIIEACPTKRKNAMMNLLHSCFAWGQVVVILGSTLFFSLAGIAQWRWLARIWALVPLCNAFVFLGAPIVPFGGQSAPAGQMRSLLRSGLFWLLLVIMITAGASELAVSQWASTMAESGLGVSKAVGDLAGPCLFGAFMGLGRLIGARFDDGAQLRVMTGASVLTILSFLLIALAPIPALSLAGCALCGFAVSVSWPMTLGLAARALPQGGMALFALLAFGGDIGCTSGPSFAGLVAARCGDDLQMGILWATVFPVLMLAALLGVGRKMKKAK